MIVAAAVLLGFVLWRAGALTPPPVSAWNRVGRNHGLIDDRPLTERLGERAPFMRSFDDVANVPKLLTIAGRSESATAWVLRTVALSVLVMLAGFALELIGFASRGELPFPLIYCVGLAVVAFLIGYLLLRVAAKRRQQALQAGLGGALTELAILTYNHQMSIENALDLLARSQSDPTLWGLLRDEEWRKLVVLESSRLVPFREQPFVSVAAIYEKIGHAYGVPMFALLGSTMRRIDDKGLAPRSVLTNLARTVGANSIAEMQVRSEQSKFRQAIPIGLMIVPLLLLIGYPAWVSLSRAFQ
ncbi:MAG TPA: hypothetical protein VOB72_01375 [Candidatus Dormibacteraeota bacterium]|nr:hypothetical protein [Candidatus Dormibacteraeota bacterium]